MSGMRATTYLRRTKAVAAAEEASRLVRRVQRISVCARALIGQEHQRMIAREAEEESGTETQLHQLGAMLQRMPDRISKSSRSERQLSRG